MEDPIDKIVEGMYTDRYLLALLKEIGASLAINCYRNNLIMTIGRTEIRGANGSQDQQVSLGFSPSARPMGLGVEDANTIWIGNQLHMLKYQRHGELADPMDSTTRSPFDGYFVPRVAHIIGDLDTHDICVDGDKNVLFASSLFNAVCSLTSKTHAAKIWWRPSWISSGTSGDCCHLNGLCTRDGKLRYVTSVSRHNIIDGWREARRNGGVVWDVVEDKLVCADLSMPHSPRWYGGKLFVLNSGRGEFGFVDFNETQQTPTGEEYHPFVAIAFFPGFLRGLSFHGKYAFIGSSSDRHDNTFEGLELGEKLKENNVTGRSGIFVLDLETGDVKHWIRFDNVIKEIYDVVVVSGVKRLRIEEYTANALATLYSIEQLKVEEELL